MPNPYSDDELMEIVDRHAGPRTPTAPDELPEEPDPVPGGIGPIRDDKGFIYELVDEKTIQVTSPDGQVEQAISGDPKTGEIFDRLYEVLSKASVPPDEGPPVDYPDGPSPQEM